MFSFFSFSLTQFYSLEIESTGVSQLTIFQNSILSLEAGDEIGIFDSNGILNSGDCSPQTGELLVGTGLWNDEQLEIVSISSINNCSFGGTQFAGFQDGNPLLIKVYSCLLYTSPSPRD